MLGLKIALVPMLFAFGVWIAWRSLDFAARRQGVVTLIIGVLGMAIGAGQRARPERERNRGVAAKSVAKTLFRSLDRPS